MNEDNGNPIIEENNAEPEAAEASAEPKAEESCTGYHFTAAEVPKENEETAQAGYQTYTGDNQTPPYSPTWQPEKPKKQKKERKGMSAAGIIALCLCCALLGGIAGLGGAMFITGRTAESEEAIAEEEASEEPVSTVMEGVRETSVLEIQPIDSSAVLTAAEVYAANVNSTVGIQTSITSTNFWGYPTTSAAAGSGFIISDDGYIVTNYHVVEDADSITVSDFGGESHDAVLIGFDESNDVAVLKIDAEGLTPVVIGDSDKMNVGDSVVAIGNPLGELTFSLTSGSVSAMNREVTMSTGIAMDLIQTDCAINSGNSGGALFNMYGEVIGITNAKYSGSGSSDEASIDNIGFAIPINQVNGIVQSIIEKGYIAKPYIGVSVSDVSSESQSYGLPKGAAVRYVEEGAPASEAGLQENDIITAINGETIEGSDDLVDIIGAAQSGDALEFTVYRQGETVTLTVTVGEKIQEALPEEEEEETEQQSSQQGMSGFPWSQFGGGFGGQGW